MKKQPLKYRLNVIGGALIIFLLIRTYVPMIGLQAGLNKNFDLWLIFYMLTLALSCLLPAMFIERMCDFHPQVIKQPEFKMEHGRLVMTCMMMFIGFSVIGSIALMPLEKLGISFPASQLLPIDSTLTLVLYFVFTSVIPAIFEELLVRGEILNLLLPYGRKFAVIASALIFMMMHTQVQSFIPVFGAGVLLACVYLYTDNIFVSMSLHFVNNAYSFVMMYMQQKVNAISAASFAAFAIAVIIALGIISAFYLKRRKTDFLRPLSEGRGQYSLKQLTKSPVLVVALLCCFMAIMEQMFRDLSL